VAFISLTQAGTLEARRDAVRVKEVIKDHVRSSKVSSLLRSLGDRKFDT
jgi:hypothetical protein